MKSPSISRGAALLCLWPMVAVSAFASHHTSPTTSLPYHSSSLHQKHNKQHHQRLHKQNGTRLHLSIPRGGASSVAGVAAAASSKLSQWTSTPTGAFNTALVGLAATTAVLKLYNKVENDGAKKKSGEVEVVSFE